MGLYVIKNDMGNKLFQSLNYNQSHCNGRVKISPNGAVLETLYTSRPIFNWGGFESPKSKTHLSAREYGKANEQSKWRAYKKIRDYAICNEDLFDLFITLTLDKQVIDRYDISVVYPKLRAFLSNRVQRDGLAYILVPELHKDGAIHFHGLINSSAVQLKDSGKKYWKQDSPCQSQRIYNVTDWKFGYTTAVKLSGDYERDCNYMTKYVMKQTDGGMIGGRYYYHGGELKSPHYEYINFTSQPDGEVYELEDAALTMVYVSDLSKCQYEPAKLLLELSR